MASGEIGLPVLPELQQRLAASAGEGGYGPVAGVPVLREAAAGYWQRRGLPTTAEQVVAGPGSKALLFALLSAVGGDVVVPVPGWVSYAAQTRLVGALPVPVPIRPGEGGVPDPARLPAVIAEARAAGGDPRTVVVTVPDNPTGTVAGVDVLAELADVARELDLVIVSDEIYRDLVFDPDRPAVSPAEFAPERTVVTTGLTKSLALGGWRTGVARLPVGELGALGVALRDRLTATASQIWSSPAVPVQHASAYAFGDPPDVAARIVAGRRLHEAVVRAVAERLIAAGARLAPVRATCYLYADFEPLRDVLGTCHGLFGGRDLAGFLGHRHGIGVLPAAAFGESGDPLRVRLATSRLYGDTDLEREATLAADRPLDAPSVRAALTRIGTALDSLTRP